MGLNNLLNSTYIPQFDEWSNKYGYDNLVNALTQGLNLGNKDIADWQQLNNVRIPKTQTDLDLARAGLFNEGLPNQNYMPVSVEKQPSGFWQGYQDNYANPIGQTNLPAEKNWQTRLGEGLGTLGRFVDSPLGRGLIGAGLMAAVGGNPAYAVGTGLAAGVGRQNAMTADKVYRNELKNLGYSDDDLSQIRGNITGDIYKNLVAGARLNSNRITYGQLAVLDPDIAEMLEKNPEMTYQYIPQTLANSIYTKKRQKTESDIEKSKADTEYKQNRLKQIDRQLDLLDKKIAVSGGNSAMANSLRAEKLELEKQKMAINAAKTQKEIELLDKYLGNSGGTTPRPVGTSGGSGLKFVGVRKK